MSVEVVADTLMTQHHPLGPTGRSRRIDKVSKGIRRNLRSYIRSRFCSQQGLHIDGLIGRHTVQTVGGGDDVACFAVFQDKSDAVSRIFRVTRDIRSTRFQHTEERENQSAGTWQEQCYTVVFTYPTAAEGSCDAIGHFIHLFISIGSIDSDQGLLVGCLRCKVMDAVVEELEWCFSCSSLTQMGEFLFLLWTDDRELTHIRFWLLHHVLGYCYDTLGQRRGESFRVNRIIILHHDAT